MGSLIEEPQRREAAARREAHDDVTAAPAAARPTVHYIDHLDHGVPGAHLHAAVAIDVDLRAARTQVPSGPDILAEPVHVSLSPAVIGGGARW